VVPGVVLSPEPRWKPHIDVFGERTPKKGSWDIKHCDIEVVFGSKAKDKADGGVIDDE
jgi:hypothetical protein